MIFSRKVFWGATRPLRPPGIFTTCYDHCFFTHTYLLELSLAPTVCCHFITIVILHFLRASCLPTGLAHLSHKSGFFFFRFWQSSCLLTGLLWIWCRPQAVGVCTFLHQLCHFPHENLRSLKEECVHSHTTSVISLFYFMPHKNIRSPKEGGVHILTPPLSFPFSLS